MVYCGVTNTRRWQIPLSLRGLYLLSGLYKGCKTRGEWVRWMLGMEAKILLQSVNLAVEKRHGLVLGFPYPRAHLIRSGNYCLSENMRSPRARMEMKRHQRWAKWREGRRTLANNNVRRTVIIYPRPPSWWLTSWLNEGRERTPFWDQFWNVQDITVDIWAVLTFSVARN